MEVEIERMLRSKEEQLAEAQRLAHLGSWEWEIPTNTVTWSDELFRIFGLEPRGFEATYEGFLARVHPDDRELVAAEVERAYRDGTSFSFEHRIVRPDGEVRWLQGRGMVLQDDAGKPVRMCGTSQDITERRRLAEENQLLAEVGHIVSSSLDIDQVYEKFAQELKKLVEFDRVAVNIIDQEAGVFIPKYQSGERYAERAVNIPVPLAGTMTEYVLRTGQSLVRGDITGSDNLFQGDQVRLQSGLRATVSVPLVAKSRIIGTMSIHSTRSGAYGLREQVILERMANQIAPAIENARLYQQTRQAEEALRRVHDELEERVQERTAQFESANQELHREIAQRKQAEEELRRREAAERRLALENEVLAEIGRVISSSLDIGEVYDRFAEQVSKLIPFDRISIARADFERSLLTHLYTRGLEVPSMQEGAVSPLVGSLVEAELRSGLPLILGSESASGLLARYPRLEPIISAGVRSLMVVPLISKGKPIGVLALHSTRDGAYTEREASLGERIGAQIAGAVANAQLHAEVRQAEQTIREMSTPVLQIQERLLLLPLIGVVYPQRASQLTDQLLNAIRTYRARAVVIDITGVASMDSVVGSHLVKTVAAARLLGAAIIVTGVSSEIAQSLVKIGTDLSEMNTLGDLQSGIEEAQRLLEGRIGPVV